MESRLGQSYDELAADYNQKRFSGRNGHFLYDTDRRIVRSMLRMADPHRMIDVPVGTGRTLEYVTDMSLDVVGVDYTPEMLEVAASAARPERHTLIQGNAADLPFADGEFDCLVSLRFFHLFPREDRAAFAGEFSRVVRPGGHAIISFTNGWYAGGLNWLRATTGMKTVFFEYPGELRTLFPQWRVRKVSGNYLPKQWLIDRLPFVGRAARFATTEFPLNRICWERFYLLQKPL